MDETGPRWPLMVGILGLMAAAVMGVVLVQDDGEDEGDTSVFEATAAGFVIEPAAEVGPDAFTPPFDTGDAEVCDVGRFVAELTARPEALGEWARVLGLPVELVPAYAESLRPTVLDEDTTVTNHGLRDGVAYARPSQLPAGTAVLMGDIPGEVTSVPPEVTVPTTPTTPTTPATTVTTFPAPSTTEVAEEVPVTRCRCGNPLLPAYAPAGEPTPVVTTTTVPPPSEPDEPFEPAEPAEPGEPAEPLEPSTPPSDDIIPSYPEPTDDVPPASNDPDPDPPDYPDPDSPDFGVP